MVLSFPDWTHQLSGPCGDVPVLWAGCLWPPHAPVPVVEALPDLLAAGKAMAAIYETLGHTGVNTDNYKMHAKPNILFIL